MMTQWELALDAVLRSGVPVTAGDVLSFILVRKPGYKRSNVGPDLSMLSVNSPSRTHYSGNAQPRRTDAGHRLDRLFKIGHGTGVRYEPYNPVVHGVWEIIPDPRSRSGFAVKHVGEAMQKIVDVATEEACAAGAFDPHNVVDAREKVLQGIVRRRGQPAFRNALLRAYGGACAMTGCRVLEILEAAHIHPYRGGATNEVKNGLLLRADVHTLFDVGLLVVMTPGLVIRVSPQLSDSEYAALDGRSLALPKSVSVSPSLEALDWHRSRAGWSLEE